MSIDVEATRQFFDAIRVGDADAVRTLVQRNPALPDARQDDAGGLSALMTAIYFGRRDVADALIAGGADVDAFAAAALGDAGRITALLDADPALVDARSSDGWTPLHLAAHFGHAEVAEMLLDRGAPVDARSTNAMTNTALHAALAGRHLDVTALLLTRGADVDARQRGGFTALHAAAQHGDSELVTLLLRSGADPSLATDDGRTALSIAHEQGHAAVADILTAH